MKNLSKYLRCDLHVHTNFSFDSQATMEQYVEQALRLGVDVICFTDHIDVNKHYDTFKDFRFDARREAFERIRDKHCDKVKLLYGFEVGEPHLHPEVMEFVYAQNPDMIIGSVHYPLDYLDVDHAVSRREYERIYDRFVREMVECGGFDVLGHADMPKKYHDDYEEDLDYVAETLRLCAVKGIVPEINTSSIRSGATDAMPSLQAVERYAQFGKYVTINSDSHTPASLGYAFDEIYRKLPENLRICYFEKRRIVEV